MQTNMGSEKEDEQTLVMGGAVMFREEQKQGQCTTSLVEMGPRVATIASYREGKKQAMHLRAWIRKGSLLGSQSLK